MLKKVGDRVTGWFNGKYTGTIQRIHDKKGIPLYDIKIDGEEEIVTLTEDRVNKEVK
jgi:hypothetical protein